MKCIVQHVLHVCTVLRAHMSHKHLELHILLPEEDCLSVPFLGHYMHVCILEGFLPFKTECVFNVFFSEEGSPQKVHTLLKITIAI